jgi:hypothetical protein
VLQNTSALPHAWIVHDVRQMPKEEILNALDTGAVDPRRIALVETEPPAVAVSVQGKDAVSFVAYEPERITMDVSAASAGMLVLSEIYLPGWNVYLDGDKSEVLPTDYALRGVGVPTGSHRIEFRYEPASLRYGLWISAVAGAAMVIVWAIASWTWLRNRNANSPE